MHDLNAEVQKSNVLANDLDELDNEVAMISRKSPKNQMKSEDKSNRNFNSIPRNYDEGSESGKEEEKKEKGIVNSEGEVSEEKDKGPMITTIVVCGAKGMQSKINL